ncbi:MAG: anti-anti-sigma factor [Flavobacteriales bacterium CG_4_10_14_0_2_um_filter_32_8]|nr:MAG: anti-anti-sigma factor [Flavobacteriales bacterium CG_4_10_14_0_2_um_filter_32_8]PJB15814.1 MAG: anti-anti-sigma factor [Flavobacteriales bacterium CG_4_9_14_3_um_filter_32_8]
MNFSYKIKKDQNFIHISFIGNLMNKQQVDRLLDEIEFYSNEGFNKIIIDLSEMKYMNSTGLNILINIFTQTRSNGGDVIITNIPEKIKKLLIITKLNSIFNIEETVDKAKKILI